MLENSAAISYIFPDIILDINKENYIISANQVLETNRVEESQSHVHRMYFMGPNTFSDPWHLPHTPPEQVKEIV